MLRSAVFAVLPIALCGVAAGQSAPAIEELVARNLAARGGADKIKAVQTIKATAKAFVMGGIELPITIYLKRPSSMRFESSIQGKSMIQAFDGTDAWTINPLTGTDEAKAMSAQETKQMRNNAADSLDGSLLDYKEKGTTLVLTGQEDVEGSPAYKILVTRKDGSSTYEWLDVRSFLEVKTSGKVTQMGQEVEVETFASDYRAVAGVMLPYVTDQRLNGQSMMKMTIENVVVNGPVDDALFKFPGAKPEAKPAEKPAAKK